MPGIEQQVEMDQNKIIQVRPINPESTQEIELVAMRMQQTLIEVLGAERGRSMYSMDWLIQRVLWHLDASQVCGQVFVAENIEGEIVGHTIVRIDKDDDENEIGLFSTTYVDPASRRFGVATLLRNQGEQWMLENEMATAVTYTDKDNTKLQNLYLRHGYTMSSMPNEFVKLAKILS